MAYNGWRNRETWLVSIWFNPESRDDVESARATLEDAVDSAPDFLQDFIYLEEIDWDELGGHFDEDEPDAEV